MLEVRRLTKVFSTPCGPLRALFDVSFTLQAGETLALVGENGSGKTTLAKLLLRILRPTSGALFLEDEPLENIEQKTLARKIQMVFQNPFSSLNPRLSIEKILREPLEIQGEKGPLRSKVEELLIQVGLPRSFAGKYPHACSGGERQRVALARALALSPKILVLDESLSSLDAFTQREILFLLQEIKKRRDLALLFISHDLALVRRIADRVAILERGSLVELKKAEELFQNAEHPHTQKLLTPLLEMSYDSPPHVY